MLNMTSDRVCECVYGGVVMLCYALLSPFRSMVIDFFPCSLFAAN